MEILILVASTILAFEITLNSDLADAVKGRLGLKLDQQKSLKALSYTLFWNSLFGIKWYVIMYPITLLLSLFFSVWQWINNMFNCPYCLGYHLSWIGLVTITETTFAMALLYALFSIAIGKLYSMIN